MIIDVSLNGGGRDQVSAGIAARFVDRRRLAMVSEPYRSDGLPSTQWVLSPGGVPRYRKPIYLLSSDRMSAPPIRLR